MNNDDIIEEFQDFDIEFQVEDLDEQERMRADFEVFYKLVGRFLDNMSKNPSATTMKWPTRAKDIAEFQNKINKLVGGYFG